VIILCPTADLWELFLEGTLAEADQARLAGHLDTCTRCRKIVESLAGDLPTAPETGLQIVLEKMKKPGPEETQDEPKPAADTASDPDGNEFPHPPGPPGEPRRLDHYRILEAVGKGAFGTVNRAFDTKLQRTVAIKVLSPERDVSGTARQRFIREARSAAAVMHDNVVTLHAVEEDHDIPYIVMQFVEGVSLQDKLDQKVPLETREIPRIGLQIAEGLAAAHKQGLVHRDIKPGNILLESGTDRVKITDFGLARAVDDAGVTQSGMIVGTPLYMSPEQANGEVIDHRSDLFSLGSVLYVMCTGTPPFRGGGTVSVLKRVCEETPRPIREINPTIPQYLADLVSRLHAKKREDRFQSAREVADLLSQHLARLQPAPAPLPAPKRRSVVVFIALLTLLLLAGVGLTWWNWPRDESKDVVIKPGNTNPPIVKTSAGDDGWVSLFNGKDLSGWIDEHGGPATWKVENGHLVGKSIQTRLRTERADFADFHLRMEAKYVGGEGRLSFREQPSKLGSGYWIHLNNGKGSYNTGAVMTAFNNLSHSGMVREERTTPDTWFTLEVIAEGKHIQTFVNGEKALDFVDPHPENYADGFIALGAVVGKGELHVKKIEIKEQPPPDNLKWVPLFNGKDFTGWKPPPAGHAWEIKDGALQMKKAAFGFLTTERRDFTDFHLRMEVYAVPYTSATVDVRAGSETRSGYAISLGRLSSQFAPGSVQRDTKNGVSWQAKLDLTQPNQWYTLDVIARGKHIVTKVNGRVARDEVDDSGPIWKGAISLYNQASAATIKIRKMEIKELPPAGP
jgi:serine/threonine protein kinase